MYHVCIQCRYQYGTNEENKNNKKQQYSVLSELNIKFFFLFIKTVDAAIENKTSLTRSHNMSELLILKK